MEKAKKYLTKDIFVKMGLSAKSGHQVLKRKCINMGIELEKVGSACFIDHNQLTDLVNGKSVKGKHVSGFTETLTGESRDKLTEFCKTHSVRLNTHKEDSVSIKPGENSVESTVPAVSVRLNRIDSTKNAKHVNSVGHKSTENQGNELDIATKALPAEDELIVSEIVEGSQPCPVEKSQLNKISDSTQSEKPNQLNRTEKVKANSTDEISSAENKNSVRLNSTQSTENSVRSFSQFLDFLEDRILHPLSSVLERPGFGFIVALLVVALQSIHMGELIRQYTGQTNWQAYGFAFLFECMPLILALKKKESDGFSKKKERTDVITMFGVIAFFVNIFLWDVPSDIFNPGYIERAGEFIKSSESEPATMPYYGYYRALVNCLLAFGYAYALTAYNKLYTSNE